MSRPSRIHVRGGLYYLTQSSNRQDVLFTEDSDYAALEHFLSLALSRSKARAFAYCWLPRTIHLAVQCHDVPVGRLMQRVTGCYARYVHRRTRKTGHLFAGRFRSILVDPAWLPELVRFIHHAPVRTGSAPFADQHVYSSHALHVSLAENGWIETRAAWTTLQNRGLSPAAAREFLSAAPTPSESALFSSPARRVAVIGREVYRQSLPHGLRPRGSRLTLDQLIDVVARSQSLRRTDILSASRERRLSLCRALIAWHAIERRIASLREVSSMLGRDASTLSKAITRHRDGNPELFRLDALHRFWPLG